MDTLTHSGTRSQVRELILGARDDAEHLGSDRLVQAADEALEDLENGHTSVMVGVQGFRVTESPSQAPFTELL